MSDTEKRALFSQFDMDHDGRLTEQEYITGEVPRFLARQDSAFFRKHFQDMDKHHQGWIIPQEFHPLTNKRCL